MPPKSNSKLETQNSKPKTRNSIPNFFPNVTSHCFVRRPFCMNLLTVAVGYLTVTPAILHGYFMPGSCILHGYFVDTGIQQPGSFNHLSFILRSSFVHPSFFCGKLLVQIGSGDNNRQEATKYMHFTSWFTEKISKPVKVTEHPLARKGLPLVNLIIV